MLFLKVFSPRVAAKLPNERQVTLARLSLLKERGDSGTVPLWQHLEEFMRNNPIDDVELAELRGTMEALVARTDVDFAQVKRLTWRLSSMIGLRQSGAQEVQGGLPSPLADDPGKDEEKE